MKYVNYDIWRKIFISYHIQYGHGIFFTGFSRPKNRQCSLLFLSPLGMVDLVLPYFIVDGLYLKNSMLLHYAVVLIGSNRPPFPRLWLPSRYPFTFSHGVADTACLFLLPILYLRVEGMEPVSKTTKDIMSSDIQYSL